MSSHCFTSQWPSRCPFGGLGAQGIGPGLRCSFKVSFQTCLLLLKLVYEVPRILLAGDRIDNDACDIALRAIAALRCLPVAPYLPSPAFGACRELRRLGRHAFMNRASRVVITKLFAYARDGTKWRREVGFGHCRGKQIGAGALSHAPYPNNPDVVALDHNHSNQTPARINTAYTDISVDLQARVRDQARFSANAHVMSTSHRVTTHQHFRGGICRSWHGQNWKVTLGGSYPWRLQLFRGADCLECGAF